MSLLGNLLGGGRGGGMSPITMGLLGLLAYRTVKGKGRLADMLGRSDQDVVPGGVRPPNWNNSGQPGGGGLGGMLGGLLGGGAAGSLLSGGLGDLIKSFQQSGQGEKAETWVAKGPNAAIAPPDLERALGPEKIEWLMQETGMSREELLAGLSRELPEAVDELTPDGRIPTEQEAARWTSAKWT
jgi:uncharacterized protein YidB (DUF937 family)